MAREQNQLVTQFIAELHDEETLESALIEVIKDPIADFSQATNQLLDAIEEARKQEF